MSKQISIDFDSANCLSSSSKYVDFASFCSMSGRIHLTIINNHVVK